MLAALLISGALALQAAPSEEAEAALAAFQAEYDAQADIAAELAALFVRDQAARFAIIKQFQNDALTGEDRDWLSSEAGSIIDGIDENNTARLREILDTVGWAQIDSMQRGRIMRFAWMLLSHADHDPEFQLVQLETLERLRRAGQLNHLDVADFAKLYDSVAITEGRRQRYGTQLECVEGSWAPIDVEDRASLGERREDVGLDPLDAYIATHAELYGACP